MSVDKTNKNSKSSTDSVDVSKNRHSPDKVNFLPNGDGGGGFFTQLLDDFTTLSDDGTGLVIGDEDLEGDGIVGLLHFGESGVGGNLADVGKDKVDGLVNSGKVTLRGRRIGM